MEQKVLKSWQQTRDERPVEKPTAAQCQTGTSILSTLAAVGWPRLN